VSSSLTGGLRRAVVRLTVAVTAVAGIGLTATTSHAAAAPCTDVEVSFARGSFEPGSAGILVGRSFISELKKKVPGKSISDYGVDYPASVDLSGPSKGIKDLINHLKTQSAACPNQKFVLGGYSQGAFIIDASLGIKTLGEAGITIPLGISPKIAAAVVFGDPSRLVGKKITDALLYAGRVKEWCQSGDPVCGNGFNIAAHLSYGAGPTKEAAAFVAGKI
jgi:cutinase